MDITSYLADVVNANKYVIVAFFVFFFFQAEDGIRDDRNSIVFERLHLSAKIIRCGHQLGRSIFETMVKKHDEFGGAIGIARRRNPGLVDPWESFPDSPRESRVAIGGAGAFVDVA